jgi:hypothetical protein
MSKKLEELPLATKGAREFDMLDEEREVLEKDL